MNIQKAFYDLRNWRYKAVHKAGKNTLEIFPEKELAAALAEEDFTNVHFSVVLTATGWNPVDPGDDEDVPGDVIEDLFGGDLDEGLEFEDMLARLFFSVELMRGKPVSTLVTYKSKEDWVCEPGDRQADFQAVQQLHEAVLFHLGRLGHAPVPCPFDKAHYTAFRERMGLEDSRMARSIWAADEGTAAKERN